MGSFSQGTRLTVSGKKLSLGLLGIMYYAYVHSLGSVFVADFASVYESTN